MASSLTRRECLTMVAGVAGLVASPAPARAVTGPKRIKAVALDGFTTFDPRPVSALAEQLFPGRGGELSRVWRTRQFEYTWLRTLSRRYVDFWRVTEDALVFAARAMKLELSVDDRDRLMEAYLRIKAWPDALPALTALRGAGIRLAFLSNFTPAMLDAAVRNAGLEGLFEPHLSTDLVRAYKPDPRAYHMGVDTFGLPPDEIAFAAFAGWDAAGSKAFGYPTFWINRLNQPVEELGVAPDAIGSTLDDLARFVTSGLHGVPQ
jgi:2-haloacid dehalogenase